MTKSNELYEIANNVFRKYVRSYSPTLKSLNRTHETIVLVFPSSACFIIETASPMWMIFAIATPQKKLSAEFTLCLCSGQPYT